MRLRVCQLRARGYARRSGEVSNGASYVGDLIMGEVWVSPTERRHAAQLSPGGHHGKNVLPCLFEPTLINIGYDWFQLRGYERIDVGDGPLLVVQEWRCEFVTVRDGKTDRPWHPSIEKEFKREVGHVPERK